MGSKRSNSIVIRDEPKQEEKRMRSSNSIVIRDEPEQEESSRIAALENIKGKNKANKELEEGKTDSNNDDNKDYSPTEKKINDEKALQLQISYQEGQHSQTSNSCDDASGIRIHLKFEFTLLETSSRTEFPNEQRQTRDFLSNVVAAQSEQEYETGTLNLFPITPDPRPEEVPSMLGAEDGQNDPATTLGRSGNNGVDPLPPYANAPFHRDVLRLGGGTQNNTLKNKHGGAAASSSKERGPKPKTREIKFGEIPALYDRSFPFGRLQQIIAPPFNFNPTSNSYAEPMLNHAPPLSELEIVPPSPSSSHMEERLVQIPDLNQPEEEDDDEMN